ncbi:MAG: hypothetical protein ACE148_02320 [Vicinamibacterales bacterium]
MGTLRFVPRERRHVVIIDLLPAAGIDRQRLYGYALEAGCPRTVA